MSRLLLQRLSGYKSSRHLLFRNMTDSKPIETTIRKKLTDSLVPKHADVINESYMHNTPKNAETHFKIVIVSDQFTDVPTLKRHRMIYDLLADELQNGVHALSILAKTPSEWEGSDQTVKPSPNCKGGFGK